jgi:hypothetical protein
MKMKDFPDKRLVQMRELLSPETFDGIARGFIV